MSPLLPYPLPAQVLDPLIALAQECDVLLIGELHGTQEIPRLVFSLLDPLTALGYGGLGLEIPHVERDRLEQWALDESNTLPRFFSHPSPDGRGNVQVLELARSAAKMHQWRILCFDQAFLSLTLQWTERDERMARNFLTQRTELCPSGKVVAICGGGHARLRANTYPKFFPSFARQLQLLDPNLRVGAVSINFVAGAFFNMGVRRLLDPQLLPPQLNEILLKPSDEFSYALQLPIATPATFLAPTSALERINRAIVWNVADAITKLRTQRRNKSA